jgi:hypothetical protein
MYPGGGCPEVTAMIRTATSEHEVKLKSERPTKSEINRGRLLYPIEVRTANFRSALIE